MGTYETLQNFRLFRIILASTYILHFLLVIWLQFQRKILRGRIRSYRNRNKLLQLKTECIVKRENLYCLI